MIIRTLSAAYHRMFGSKALRAYESICIDAWRRNLSDDCAKILDWQLEKYDLVQRMSGDKLVCLYRLGDKRGTSFPSEYLFALNDSEVPPVASIYLSLKGRKGSKPLKADIVVVSGRFFGIEFNIPPSEYFSGLSWDKIDAEVREVKVWRDLTVVREEMVSQREKRAIFNDWPTELLSDALRLQSNDESSRDEFNNLLESIDAKLPSDYLELISHVGGAAIFGWIVLGLKELRRIVYPKDNYYILAENDGKAALVVKEGSYDAEIYLLDIEGNEVSKLGKSLKTALVSQKTLA